MTTSTQLSTNVSVDLRIEKRNFCGVDLDIILGHPDHEVLFFATQAATATGLADPKNTVQNTKERLSASKNALQIKDLAPLVEDLSTLKTLSNSLGHPRWREMWLFTEAGLCSILMRGHSPQTEPFRKWVTEEVLPTIRKTRRGFASWCL